MRKKMSLSKRIHLLALCLLGSVASFGFTVNGIEYGINSASSTATVSNYQKGLSGDIVIPEKIKAQNGLEYVVTEIDSHAFESTDITGITIPNTVKNIGEACFLDCKKLVFATLPDGITRLDYQCFTGCESLKSITIPNTVTEITLNCFQNCKNLTSITLPDSITQLDQMLFSGCTSLTSITIPNNVKNIEMNCFYNCKSLTSITIPSHVTRIESDCFEGCTGLKTITCLCVTPPNSLGFFNLEVDSMTLYIPKGTLAVYQATNGWRYFGKIKEISDGPVAQHCAAPVISYKDGHLVFTSETEGAKFHYMLDDKDVASSYTNNDGDVALTGTYYISVYATADDCIQSDVTTGLLYWLAGTSETVSIDKPSTRGIFVEVHGSTISLAGLNSGESVSFYSADGSLIGSTKASGQIAVYDTGISRQIVIVKIGSSSIKVVL